MFHRPALEIPSAEPTPSEQRVPSARSSPVRAEPREASPPLATATEVNMPDPPEGDAEAEPRHEDTQTHDPSAPTEESLGASQTGAEPSHDKSSVAPKHTEPQQ